MNQPHKDLRDKIEFVVAEHRFTDGSDVDATEQIMSLIHSYANEARLDELKNLPGASFMDKTPVFTQMKAIGERIAELEKAS